MKAATISAANSTGFDFAILEFHRQSTRLKQSYARPVGSSIRGFLPALEQRPANQPALAAEQPGDAAASAAAPPRRSSSRSICAKRANRMPRLRIPTSDYRRPPAARPRAQLTALRRLQPHKSAVGRHNGSPVSAPGRCHTGDSQLTQDWRRRVSGWGW